MMKENKEILLKANEAISNGDHEAFLSYCTEDSKWTFVGDQVLEGKETIRKWMQVEYAVPPKFKVKNLIAEGDYVTAIGKITLTDKDGKASQYSYCDIWRFENKKLAELQAFVIPD